MKRRQCQDLKGHLYRTKKNNFLINIKFYKKIIKFLNFLLSKPIQHLILIIIYNKIQIQPFTLKTLLTIILLILVYLICFKLDFDNIFLSIAVKTILSATLFISICVKANLSDDINKLISDIYLRIFKK